MLGEGPRQDWLHRPGGFLITDRAMALCEFPIQARLLDVGCGTGATVRHLRTLHRMDAFGLDTDLDSPEVPGAMLRATAERLPFASAVMDGVLLECSLSVVGDPDLTLRECHRVLKPAGHLIISDMYARGVSTRLQGCLGNMETQEALERRIERHGFTLKRFEDHSEALRALWGQMVFDRGLKSFCVELGTDAAALKVVKCGYCLLTARKEGA